MKTISSLRDLEQFGIIPLTGEADALSLRILCDLTVPGCAVVREALGLASDDGFAEPMNSRGHKSMMLYRDQYELFAIIGLLQAGYQVATSYKEGNSALTVFGFDSDERLIDPVWQAKLDDRLLTVEECGNLNAEDYLRSELVVVEPWKIKIGDDEPQAWPEFAYGKIKRVFQRLRNVPGRVVGTRNVHQFSGRHI